MRGRILIIDRTTPRPDQDSGSASVFSYLQVLARSGFDVTFAPSDLRDDGPYTRAVAELGIRTLVKPEYSSLSRVVEACGPEPDIVLLYRAPIAAHVFDLARNAFPSANILFHAMDLHFLRMERQAALTQSSVEAERAQRMRAIELDLITRADATIVVSPHERDLLARLAPAAIVHEIPILREGPAQSRHDIKLLARRRRLHRLGFAGRWINRRDSWLQRRRDLLFIGSYDHRPNVDAVLWLVQNVWPILQARGFTNRLVIVGSNVPPEVAALSSERINVRGHVADLAPLLAQCRVSVAPLRFGAGVKGKIVTSLSSGVPVVATSVAAEGMGLHPEQSILVADTPDQFADQILRLYSDAELWQKLSENGCRAFEERFSLTAGSSKILAVMDELVESARQRHARGMRPAPRLERGASSKAT
jgi:glycosyltransferase involved in cell wall biosynthesis